MTTRCLDAAVISSISIYHAAKDDLPISPAEAFSGNTICLDNNIRGASTGTAKKYGHVGGEILILYEAVGKETAGFVNIEGKLFSL
jgi:hypothetical protein